MPVRINHSFLDAMAKMIPRTERIVNTLIPKVIFVFGPRMIKKKMILIRTVTIDIVPKTSFLFK
jgi:hypothetical protein